MYEAGLLLSSVPPMDEVKRVLSRKMSHHQWKNGRYLQLLDHDHHTIVTTGRVARVLPGFECRSGVGGQCVGRGLSHELGKDSVWGPPSSFSNVILLGNRPAPRVICCSRRFVLISGVKLGGAHRSLRDRVNGRGRTFVSSAETPCKAEQGRLARVVLPLSVARLEP